MAGVPKRVAVPQRVRSAAHVWLDGLAGVAGGYWFTNSLYRSSGELEPQRKNARSMSAAAILKLQAAGFSAEQVTAIAELIDSQSATRADLEATEHRLENKISDVEHRLLLQLESTRNELSNKIAAVDSQLSGKIAALDSKIEALDSQFSRKIDALEGRLDNKIATLDGRLNNKITALDGQMVLLKWMMGFVLAFQLMIFAKLFLH